MTSTPNRTSLLRKVPEITVFFWIVKLLTTAMGESTSDYLVFRINPYLAVSFGAIGFVVALALQFRTRKYVPWIYWLTVLMVAIFGTMAADVLHIQFGISYVVSVGFFAVVLALIFSTWQKTEGSLSIHTINTRRRELFYWATVVTTFALGTAAGDLTATTLGLGYFTSALLFMGLIGLVALAYWKFGLGEVAAFWLAYILTRPLGASFADWMGKPTSAGGLGWGDGVVSLGLAVLIIGFVYYLTVSHKDIKRS